MNNAMFAMADAVDMGLIIINKDGRIDLFNQWAKIHARIEKNPIGQLLTDIMQGSIDPRLQLAIREALDFEFAITLSHALHPTPLPFFKRRGTTLERLMQSVAVTPILLDNQDRSCLLQIRDMSDILKREHVLRQQASQLAHEIRRLNEAKEQLQHSELRFRELTRQAPVGLFETDKKGLLHYANDIAAQMLSLNTHKDYGRLWVDLLPELEIQRISQKWHVAWESAIRFSVELRIPALEGKYAWLRIDAGPIKDEHERLKGYIGTIVDITEFRIREERNEFRANHDPLTQLANRERFELRLRAAISGAKEISQRIALIYIDLDKFKPINDQYGHAAGDTVLCTISARLRRIMRGEDLVGRIGGDEFAVLIHEAPTHQGMYSILAKIQQAVALPINIGICHVKLDCSLGVAYYPNDGSSTTELFARADSLMYEEKMQKRANNKENNDN